MKRKAATKTQLQTIDPRELNALLEEYTSRLEQKVAYENQFFRLMADSMPQIVWTTQPDGVIEYFNQRWYEFTGLTEEESLATSWGIKVLHPDDRGRTRQKWRAAVASGQPFEIEYRFRDQSTGDYRWFLGRAVPAADSAGKIIKWFGTCTDIDEHKKAQERKDEFIAVASHELKTPVTSVKMYAQFLQRHFQKIDDKHAAGHMARINEQLERLSTLIRDLLDITKIESGQLVLNLSNFELDELVREVVASVKPLLKKHRIVIHGPRKLHVHADRGRLTQVLTNLLSNAVKYSPKSDKVIVTLGASASEATVCVQDFGVGISKEDLPRIFRRFYRLKSADPAVPSGLGLGLYVSSEIINRLGGRIYTESSLGQGSRFYFSLPLKSKRHSSR